MKKFVYKMGLLVIFCSYSIVSAAGPVIFVNQVGMDSRGPKIAIICTDQPLNGNTLFNLVQSVSSKKVFTGVMGTAVKIDGWMPGKYFYRADFSTYKKSGSYKVSTIVNGTTTTSGEFVIEENALARLTIPSIIHYYNKQRANTAAELQADKSLLLFGSEKRVDLHGGWCDASGDVSKYFSHLAYTNTMMPQQTPLVTWSMASVAEAIPTLLTKMGVKDSLEDEALWGADYILRSLSTEDYFYMTVFSYFKPDPSARRVVGLLANSVTTDQYQCAFREGGGMAIAALARISHWKKSGEFSSAQYLSGAKRAFAHLLINNTKYDDDGKENIIDDYGALMAATELWIATDSNLYRDEARRRANNIARRMTKAGYFRAGDDNRPFWHASDAGLPVVALTRYLAKEKETLLRNEILSVIKKALDYNLRVTNNVSNPFGYARQSFVS